MQQLIFSLLILIIPLLGTCQSEVSPNISPADSINPDSVTIIRDQWGVPHIFANTDEEAAYGIAWASAEDDFNSMQEHFLASRGKLGAVKGKGGAIIDFLVFFLDVDELIAQDYEKRISPEFKKVLNGYIQGANAYAKKHPEEVLLKDIFPINELDLIKSHILGVTLLTGVQDDIAKVFSNHIQRYEPDSFQPQGSNGIAMNKNITADGNTFIAINSHQPLTGPYAWYELHVCTKEGWNTLGATFAGAITPFVGTTPNLAWTHTTNRPDMSDVYKLEMHPTLKNKYKFDGEWLDLTMKKFKTKVKFGFLKIPYSRKVYFSKYGPTLKNETGYYAFRFPSRMEIGAPEQWYRMNKATDLDSFLEACQMQGIAGQNIIYADKIGNIFIAGNGLLPKRNPNYNWKKVLPGNTSETLWQPDFYPFDEFLWGLCKDIDEGRLIYHWVAHPTFWQ